MKARMRREKQKQQNILSQQSSEKKNSPKNQQRSPNSKKYPPKIQTNTENLKEIMKSLMPDSPTIDFNLNKELSKNNNLQKNNNITKKHKRNSSIENNTKHFDFSEYDEIKQKRNSSMIKQPVPKPDPTPEQIKDNELTRFATLFNFNVNSTRDKIKIEENSEYYDMRNIINELENKLRYTQVDYDNFLDEIKEKTEKNESEIAHLQKKLKTLVEKDIETIKKDNKVLTRDINLLDKKVDNLKIINQKEEYEIKNIITDLDKTINKLKGEINFVDDLKLRIKSLTNKEIPQDLVDSINHVLRNDFRSNKNSKDESNNNNNFENNIISIKRKEKNTPTVRTRTGVVPLSHILDAPSLDSSESIKELHV